MSEEESSITKELQGLKKLYDDEVINQKEFELAKKKLLNSTPKEKRKNKTLKEYFSNDEDNPKNRFPTEILNLKKYKILYFFILLFLIFCTLAILLFGPFNVPAFSQFGDKILGRNINIVKEIANTDLDKTQIDTDTNAEIEEVTEEEKIDEPITEKKTTSTKTSTVSCSQSDVDNYFNNFCYWYDIDGNKAADWGEKLFVICKRTDYGPEKCPKKYLCTDEQISNLRSQITEKKDGKERAEFLVNDKFFICFDELTTTVPGQTDTWYKQECGRIVCIELYADLCALPYDFQAEIDALQIELNHCLSDR